MFCFDLWPAAPYTLYINISRDERLLAQNDLDQCGD